MFQYNDNADINFSRKKKRFNEKRNQLFCRLTLLGAQVQCMEHTVEIEQKKSWLDDMLLDLVIEQEPTYSALTNILSD